MDYNYCLLLLAATGFMSGGCGGAEKSEAKESYYSMSDFKKIKKYDTHTHVNTFDSGLLHFARERNFILVSLNVAAPDYPSLEQQQRFTTHHLNSNPENFFYVTSFDIDGIGEPGWEQKTIAYLRHSFEQGAVGVKVWKNIGMEYKDKTGQFVMIDDPRLDPIFDFISANNKTLIGHLGEPKNCWLPLDSMTVENDRDYFKNHPEYHMFKHPEYPTYEDQVAARDHMLDKHPKMKFVGAHLASLEWSTDEIAKRLDKYPNMAVDMAERISHLQYQTVKDQKKVRDFFIRYQDRVVYSTDITVDDKDIDAVYKYADRIWADHWKFFATDTIMQAPEIKESFRSLHLPAQVIDKLYHKNAEKWIVNNPTE